jgi:hypothetical protein
VVVTFSLCCRATNEPRAAATWLHEATGTPRLLAGRASGSARLSADGGRESRLDLVPASKKLFVAKGSEVNDASG